MRGTSDQFVRTKLHVQTRIPTPVTTLISLAIPPCANIATKAKTISTKPTAMTNEPKKLGSPPVQNSSMLQKLAIKEFYPYR